MKWFLKVLKQYADFEGRARRKEYWMFTLFFVIIYYAFAGLAFAFATSSSLLTSIFGGLAGIFVLGILIPSIAVAVRRMHDVGKSGWFILIPIYSLILACTDSEEGTNEYGPNPKNPSSELNDIGAEQA